MSVVSGSSCLPVSASGSCRIGLGRGRRHDGQM